jgi:hypothetical protein
MFRRGYLIEVTLTNGAKIKFRCKEFSFSNNQTKWINVGNRKRLVHLPPENIAAIVRIS